MPRYLAADYAKISRETLRQWMAKDEDFLAQVHYAEAIAAGSLINKVCEDGSGAWKVLKNLKPEYFKDEVSVQQTNSYVIELQRPDGTAATLTLGVQAPQVSGPADLQRLPDTRGGIGNPGGQVPTGSLLDADEDSPGSEER